jgi:hypothetical protein
MVPVGHKRYFAQAEEWVEGPIQAASRVVVDDSLAGQVLTTDTTNLWLLVLTTDELRLFSLRWAGWRQPFRDVIERLTDLIAARRARGVRRSDRASNDLL